MKVTLIVFVLAVKSSYLENVEKPADEIDFDTVQWWITPEETWRVKTFAIDNDIHPHLISSSIEVARAVENTMKSYGDIVSAKHIFEFNTPIDSSELNEKLLKVGGFNTLELAPNKRFGFWNKDGRKYKSKSTPK